MNATNKVSLPSLLSPDFARGERGCFRLTAGETSSSWQHQEKRLEHLPTDLSPHLSQKEPPVLLFHRNTFPGYSYGIQACHLLHLPWLYPCVLPLSPGICMNYSSPLVPLFKGYININTYLSLKNGVYFTFFAHKCRYSFTYWGLALDYLEAPFQPEHFYNPMINTHKFGLCVCLWLTRAERIVLRGCFVITLNP